MSFTYLLLGFGAKIITGLDDALTNIPLLSALTRTRKGRLSFSFGVLLSIILAIAIAWIFSANLQKLPHFKEGLGLTLYIMAFAIWYDIGILTPRKKIAQEAKKVQKLSNQRIFTLIGIGFGSGFATALDDIAVFTALFTAGLSADLFASVGIILATLLELWLAIKSAKIISKYPFKDHISALGLFVIGTLLIAGIL